MINKFLINEKDTILNSLIKIDSNKKGFLIVCDDNHKLLGTITDGDIRRALINNCTKNSEITNFYKKNIKYITEKTKVSEIGDFFKSEQINFLPIINKDHKIINVLTKKQYHILLLENKKFKLNDDFINIDENKLEYEIFHRPWGFYKSTLLTPIAQSKIITVFPNEELSLQKHKRREEHWIFIKGEGKVVLEDSTLIAYPGKYMYIPKGCKHQIINTSENENLILTEVQLGSYFGEDDIIRYKDKYNRV